MIINIEEGGGACGLAYFTSSLDGVVGMFCPLFFKIQLKCQNVINKLQAPHI